MYESKYPIFLFQISGHSLCLCQSSTLFGGPASLWVETFWCWRVEGGTHCLLYTSTGEEPENFFGPFIITSPWTREYYHWNIPNSRSSRVSVLEFVSALWAADVPVQAELLTWCITWVEITSHAFCYYHQVTSRWPTLPCLPAWVRCPIFW